MELDVVAESSCGRVLIVEVKKRAVKTGITMIEDFHEKITTPGRLILSRIIPGSRGITTVLTGTFSGTLAWAFS
ncbi:MAG: hypothetical protein HQK66_13430, partial [Desulfamplus sp.]|nr:hypothetical protein [Desulfamplus sp.]